MADFVEVKVKVSNEEQKYTQKFPCYESITISRDDPVLSKMVEDTLKNFKGDVDEVRVVFTYTWN
jgi:hypothetical protein